MTKNIIFNYLLISFAVVFLSSCNNDAPNSDEQEIDVLIPNAYQKPVPLTETEAAIIESANDFACRLFSETKMEDDESLCQSHQCEFRALDVCKRRKW